MASRAGGSSSSFIKSTLCNATPNLRAAGSVKLLHGRDVTIYRTSALKIEFTKLVLRSCFHLSTRLDGTMTMTGPLGLSNRNAVGDCQRHKGFPHADFVGKDHARLGPQSMENTVDFCPLSLLIGRRHALVQPLAED